MAIQYSKDTSGNITFTDSSNNSNGLVGNPATDFGYQAWIAAGNVLADPTVAQLQVAQITSLTAAYNSAIQLPVSYMSTTFQADLYSQDLVTKCLSPGAVPSGFFWLDANNAKVTMTFAQLQGLAAAMLAQGQAAFAKLQTLKAQVRAAATVAAVKAVAW